MKDEKIMNMIPEDFHVAVEAAYEQDDMYVIEFANGWGDVGISDLTRYDKIIKLPKNTSCCEDTIEYHFNEFVSMEEAEICPICGDVKYIRIEKGGNGKYRIGCRSCHLWYDYIFDNEDEALAAWKVRQKVYDTDNFDDIRHYYKFCETHNIEPKI